MAARCAEGVTTFRCTVLREKKKFKVHLNLLEQLKNTKYGKQEGGSIH